MNTRVCTVERAVPCATMDGGLCAGRMKSCQAVHPLHPVDGSYLPTKAKVCMIGCLPQTVKEQVVRNDVAAAAALGADGIVLGLLTAGAEVDLENLEWLVGLCRSQVPSLFAA